MNFDKYCKMIECKVSMYLGSDYEVSLRKVTKNNGVVLTGIMARLDGNDICPTLYLDDYYDEMLTADEIEYIGLKIANGLRGVPKQEYPDVSQFTNYESAGERIVYKLINAEANKELLLDAPHRRFHNLAIVCFYADDTNGSMMSILIRNEQLKMWGIEEEELFTKADSNTPKCFPGHLRTISDMVNDLCDLDITDDVNMYVLTNEKKMYGAATMLYPDMLREAYNRMGGDFYILPSSVHELVLVPKDMTVDAKGLLEMVTQINRSEVCEEEVLADSVYYYNGESGCVEWIC